MTYKRNLAIWIGLLALPWLILPNVARADAIYTYTGNPYTECGGEGSATYTCNGTTPALSITFETANPLSDNLNLKDITNKLTSLTITDGGGVDITLSNAVFEDFEISTNASGNITDWVIYLFTDATTADPVSDTVESYNYGSGDNEDYSEHALETVNKKGIGTLTAYGVGENDGSALISTGGPSNPGMWASPSAVPEPSSLFLLSIGLLALVGYGRVRRVTDRC